jgi:hypothetical protein
MKARPPLHLQCERLGMIQFPISNSNRLYRIYPEASYTDIRATAFDINNVFCNPRFEHKLVAIPQVPGNCLVTP